VGESAVYREGELRWRRLDSLKDPDGKGLKCVLLMGDYYISRARAEHASAPLGWTRQRDGTIPQRDGTKELAAGWCVVPKRLKTVLLH
jgi:hypothetical protein